MKLPRVNPVYATFKGGFGDIWGAANYFLRRSVETTRPSFVSSPDTRLWSILPLLESRGSVLETSEPPDILFYSHPTLSLDEAGYEGVVPAVVLRWSVVFAEPYFRTRRAQWIDKASGIVSFQLTSRHPDSPRTCPPADIEKCLGALTKAGYKLKRLGLPMALEEVIDVAAESDFFVGVDSGMSHVCHSVGTPVHIIRNCWSEEALHSTHSGNPYRCYTDIAEFLEAHHFKKDVPL